MKDWKITIKKMNISKRKRKMVNEGNFEKK